MTSLAATRPVPPRTSLLLSVRDTVGVARRNLLHVLRTPQLLAISALQPAMILIVLSYVFKGAIHVPGESYVNYLAPAIFLEAALIGGMTTAFGLAQDFKQGMIDRLRSLPMSRSAVLAGRTLADLSRSVTSLAIMVGIACAIGFRFQGSPGGILAALGLVVLFSYSFSWLYATVGIAVGDPEAAQSASFLPFMILMFISNALVPVADMPGWLQPFANNQPVSVTADAIRALFEGHPAGHWVLLSLAWMAGIIIVFSTISLRLYRTKAS
jgi:ABC transporter DrrB family efflux protein